MDLWNEVILGNSNSFILGRPPQRRVCIRQNAARPRQRLRQSDGGDPEGNGERREKVIGSGRFEYGTAFMVIGNIER